MLFSSSVSFHSEAISFDLSDIPKTTDWIVAVIENEGKKLGEINYVFCSDEYLLKMNIEHLNHDTYTDIITFNYCEQDVISSDIFISIDRVKENASTFSVSFVDELDRVIIHGVLHLLGYNDKTEEEQEQMTLKEDFYLSLRK